MLLSDLKFFLCFGFFVAVIVVLGKRPAARGRGLLLGLAIINATSLSVYYFATVLLRMGRIDADAMRTFYRLYEPVGFVLQIAEAALLLVYVISLKPAVAPALPESRGQAETGLTPPVQAGGYGGWLAFFCITHLYVAPVIVFIMAVSGFVTAVSLAQEYPGVEWIALLQGLLAAGITAFGAYCAFVLRELRPGAVRLVRKYLWVGLGLAIASLWLPFVGHLSWSIKEQLLGEQVVWLAKSVVGCILWLGYFAFSQRIKAAFPTG